MALSRLTKDAVGGCVTLSTRIAFGHGCGRFSYVGSMVDEKESSPSKISLSQDLCGGWKVTVEYSAFDALLTERSDPYGNSIHFYYTNSGSLNLLAYVVDYDGRTNTLTYSNNLLTRVDMPYGRSVSLTYNQGYPVSISDAQGMYSSFTYDGAPYFLTRMTTPYGATDFAHTDQGFWQGTVWAGNAGGTNRTSRAIKITHPDTSHELYAYRYDSSLKGFGEQIGQFPVTNLLGTLDSGVSNI